MSLTKLLASTAIAGSLGAAALGMSTGVAEADPGYGGPHGHGHAAIHERPGGPWRGGYEHAGHDHRPFQYHGRWVTPVFDPARAGWGFWLGPVWIPL
ncbi:hypothetical protein H7J88_12525 [Mycolicibacterium flavescens]|uniref:Uncharacterized protein n=1 Tax=Mycolicibacterium flavescens TaxID=1776 RepID=A0A1E3RGB5_MYCFV|nr:hypothetical protein [Mycolicibacterium flavescens]MCV7280474.1 hypothetical protein [Mycolicibacterium flavescens]ODQ88904.1 hypothetical protein BHQ18_16840 [Mycolicibacterium flavescens]